LIAAQNYMGVHSPTPSGSRVKWTHLPSVPGHEGSPPPTTALHNRRHALFTHTEPPLHFWVGEQDSVTPLVPSDKHAVAPVGSAIWQVVADWIDAHDEGLSASQLFTG
jgi:hypothetical protein